MWCLAEVTSETLQSIPSIYATEMCVMWFKEFYWEDSLLWIYSSKILLPNVRDMCLAGVIDYHIVWKFSPLKIEHQVAKISCRENSSRKCSFTNSDCIKQLDRESTCSIVETSTRLQEFHQKMCPDLQLTWSHFSSPPLGMDSWN